MRKLILRNFQSAGDIVMLTAAVRDLHVVERVVEHLVVQFVVFRVFIVVVRKFELQRVFELRRIEFVVVFVVHTQSERARYGHRRAGSDARIADLRFG
jgi:hypothetical protein